MVENSLVFIIKFKKGEKIKVNMRQNIMKQIFRLNKRPVNMEKVICAAISGGFPILVGILLGNIRYGLIASIGGFTYYMCLMNHMLDVLKRFCLQVLA